MIIVGMKRVEYLVFLYYSKLMEPVIVLAFANDRDDYLPMINRERKSIFKALQTHDDQNVIKVLREESTSVEDIFDILNYYRGRVAIFHYGGHAGCSHLQLETMTGDSQRADARGLAPLMGQQEALQLVFLNGCATKKQVQLLLSAGVPAVIATSVPIEDGKAVEFAEQFYKALASHTSIKKAFETAAAFMRTKFAQAREIGMHRGVSWEGKEKTANLELPWGLYIHPDKSGALKWKLPELKRPDTDETKPKLGPLVSKMCNRVVQVRTFWEFFQRQSGQHPKHPQFYFIHGNELAGHESFLERLMRTCLKEFAEREYGEEHATVCLEEVAWPKEGSLTEQQEQLPFNLMHRFDKWGSAGGFGAAVLSTLPCMEKRPLVLIKHNIYSSKWDKQTIELIKWYMESYWADIDIDANRDIPLFLVFFNVKYQQSTETGLKGLFSKWKSYTAERIKGELESVCPTPAKDSGAACLVLNELNEVEIEDVLDWFDENDLFQDEVERKEKAESIFTDTHSGLVKPKAMAKVERKLKKIIEEHQREEL
jgi:hypothetical protein